MNTRQVYHSCQALTVVNTATEQPPVLNESSILPLSLPKLSESGQDEALYVVDDDGGYDQFNDYLMDLYFASYYA